MHSVRCCGFDATVAASVKWRDPLSGQLKEVTQRISRVQFATSFAESPLPIQAATVAAETAEVLRGSFFAAAPSRSLEHVWELALKVNPRLAERPSFQEFVSLVERIERVYKYGGVEARDRH